MGLPRGRRMAGYRHCPNLVTMVLYTMDSEGHQLRAITRESELRGTPAWAPDGHSRVSAVLRGEPHLMNSPLDGGTPSLLVSESSTDPVWSPDGRYLIYSGADVGTTFSVRAVARDGRSYPIDAAPHQ